MAPRKSITNEQAQKQLTDALFRLARQKPFSSITITELCAEAKVSRMAFYRNYQEKEGILTRQLDRAIAQYRIQAATAIDAGAACTDLEPLTVCFTFFKDHQELIENLFACNLGQIFIGAVADFMYETWGTGTLENRYALAAWAGAVSMIYIPWANNDFAESPEYIARVVSDMTANGSLA